MKKKVLLIVLAAVLAAAMFTACAPAGIPASEAPAESQAPAEAPAEATEAPAEPADATGEGESFQIGLVTKVAGHPIFEAITQGAKNAGEPFGDVIDSQGPTDASAEKQVEIINNFIAQQVDAILISGADPDAVAPALKKAMEAGIVVVSYDSDVAADARQLFVNTADPDGIARQMVDAAYEAAGGEGQIAILSAAATAANQNAWIASMEEYLKEDKNKGLEMVSLVYGDDQMDKSLQEANGLLKSYPDLKVIISPTGVGILAAAKAVQDAGLAGKVFVTGLGTPSETAEYIKAGVINKAFLYNPTDLGYVTELVGRALKTGAATAEEGSVIPVGDMGEREVGLGLNGETQIILADAAEFNIDNIDEWAPQF